MARSVPTGSRIRDRRLALGLRQVALAADAGISASYLNLIEHNRRAIGGALLSRLAELLDSDRAALSGEDDAALVAAITQAGAARDMAPASLAQADDLARRHPDWARLVAAQAGALETQIHRLDALSDRLGHDPVLADAMHELLSTVSTVRATASILAQTPEIDRNWLGRFLANLDEDSRRLAESAEAVVALFDGQVSRGHDRLLPSEAVARFFDRHGHRFPELERAEDVGAVVAGLVAEIADPVAREMAAEMLAADAADAARLPLELVAAASDPADLVGAAGGDLPLVLRRLGIVDTARGLAICDVAGGMVRRKAVAGFPMPAVGAGCALLPLYAALTQPGRPLVAMLETPDGARWRAHAIAAPIHTGGFDTAPVLRATMLLTRADGVAGTGRVERVGPGCRACTRDACPARREPSLMVSAGRA